MSVSSSSESPDLEEVLAEMVAAAIAGAEQRLEQAGRLQPDD